jgi:pyridoxal phosphate enzyme (YggS family)
MAMIADKLHELHERLARACEAAARPVQSVTLLVVSKTFGPGAVREAIMAGEHRFGENYVQEGVDKIAALADARSRVEWHLIGPLQSNKTRVVAEQFDWVHSVDRLKIAQRLSEQRPAHLPPLQVCLQVNISGEPSKSGLRPDEVLAVARAVAALPHLALRGLMAVPEPAADFSAQRAPHRALHALMESLNTTGLALDTLSMGMSADLEAAIAEGATMVRVGSAIFGSRPAVRPDAPETPSVPETPEAA